tara:strand:+ start:22239 stop:23003 length:765 start_codon:yes stop_codon:yes gene_type:complete
MNIIIITQDDPFYLGKNLDFLLKNFPSHSKVVGCVVTQVSPFGKRESFLQKAIKTWKLFGTFFFLRYAFRYICAKLYRKYIVYNVLARYGVPVIKLQGSLNKPESLNLLRSYSPDLLISIAGNEIFKKPLIDLAPKGCLNLHTALLPKYRGLMPSFWVLKNGEKETGVTVFFVDEGIDSGPIIVQKCVEIGNMSQEQLIQHTKHLGMKAIIEAINKIHTGNYELIENDDTQKSYYSFPTKQDVQEFRARGARFY